MLPGLGDEVNEPVKVVPLRMLLSALTLLALVGACGFLLWDLSSGSAQGAASLFLLILVLGGAAASLLALRDLSVNGLRVAERVVFAALTAYLAWTAYGALDALLAVGDVASLRARWDLTLVHLFCSWSPMERPSRTLGRAPLA